MNRRTSIKWTSLASSVGWLAGWASSASSEKSPIVSNPSNTSLGDQFSGFEVVFLLTKDKPGRWSGKVDSHLPNITLLKEEHRHVVTITTAHEMKYNEHYIINAFFIGCQHEHSR